MENTSTKYTRGEILDFMALSPEVMVEFTKKDGTVRNMLCTRDSQLIPAEHTPSAESKIKENADVLRVFDLQKQGWRSFRIDSVTLIEAAL